MMIMIGFGKLDVVYILMYSYKTKNELINNDDDDDNLSFHFTSLKLIWDYYYFFELRSQYRGSRLLAIM